MSDYLRVFSHTFFVNIITVVIIVATNIIIVFVTIVVVVTAVTKTSFEVERG